MGTRHLVAVVLDGEYKVAQYGQWDGYLGGQGQTVVDFVREKMDLDRFKTAVRECRFVDEQEYEQLWVDAGADPASGFVSMDVSKKFGEKNPQLSRDAGAGVLSMIQDQGARLLKNSIAFAGESLFCEYAYVLDLDAERLEIFKGFNTEPLDSSERFHGFETDGEKYEPVKSFAAMSFAEINGDTINALLALEEAQDSEQ